MLKFQDNFQISNNMLNRNDFFDPGGKSALRAGKRDQSCPHCGNKNRLTKEDLRKGYQCDPCADQLERGY